MWNGSQKEQTQEQFFFFFFKKNKTKVQVLVGRKIEGDQECLVQQAIRKEKKGWDAQQKKHQLEKKALYSVNLGLPKNHLDESDEGSASWLGWNESKRMLL